MRGAGKFIWPLVFVIVLMAGGVVVFGAGTAAQSINLPDAESGSAVDDEDVPDVTARVARISFLKGDAKIRRADGGDWERAALNLPIVEGDEIVTEADARVEIQFDKDQHLRLAENSYLKIVNLKDEGIAVSLSLGTMSVRIRHFDKDKAYFEVDAPKTTLAVQKAGVYRIDAGQAGDAEIRVSVTENGEARLYSDTAGFTLKNNRSARVFIDGEHAGEWEPADSAQYADEFDTWSLERDSIIADRLKTAYYDKYYDSDIYGADDLNGNGEWIHTSQYGDVWRPYSAAVSSYVDWSPYRYGHWRWVPPFGWTWVNDEPWGWATYHHGRWFYDAGSWYWSPYGYYRYSRSWWFPALVGLNVFNNNVCWYPLPYSYGYYNYNHYYNWQHGGHHGGGHHLPPPPQTGGIKPPHHLPVPPNAVLAMGVDDFGTAVKPVKRAPLSVANAVIAKKLDDTTEPMLPAYTSVIKKLDKAIIAERPKADVIAARIKVGAEERKSDGALDNELRTTKILGGRPPLITATDTGAGKRIRSTPGDTRQTGAVSRETVVKTDRQPPIRQTNTDPPIRQNDPKPPIRQAPVSPPRVVTRRGDSDGEPGRQPVRPNPPVRQDPPRTDPPARQPGREPSPPTRQPPVKSEPKQQSPTPAKATGTSKKAAD